MNDFDLESKLKGLSVPERPEEYWEDFPALVGRQLGRVPAGYRRENSSPGLFRRFGLGFACLLMGLLVFSQPLKAASHAALLKEHVISRQLAALPRQFHILMADEHGLHYLVAEKE
jgi:hypothetical protein